MSVHDCYWSLLGAFRKPNQIDTMRSAEMKLSDTIEELKQSEHTLKTALNEVAVKVKQAQQAKAMSRVKQLLVTSASKRNSLSLTTRKRLALEQQLDCIATTQLNQQVLSSMKETSNAMKTLGLDATLSSVDEVMADMQEANTDVNDITQTLSSSISIETLDDDALNAELELLMSEEADSVLHEPVTINTTKTQKATEPVTKPVPEEAPITMDTETTVQLEMAAC